MYADKICVCNRRFSPDTKTLTPKAPTRSQQGIVLVFSLVTLLLLTLLSLNMIQQNRLEFMMAGNAQAQTETFSAAENILKIAENRIETLRANDREECRRTSCSNNGGINVSCDIPANPNAKMTAHYECPGAITWNADVPTSKTAPPTLYRCYTDTSGYVFRLQAGNGGLPSRLPWNITDNLELSSTETEVKVTSIACITSTGHEHLCDYDENGMLDKSSLCAKGTENCKTELYTLQVSSKAEKTSAQRIVESKFAVSCDDLTVRP